MILEKFDVDSIGEYLKELNLYISQKTEGKIKITTLVEKKQSDGTVMMIVGNGRARIIQVLEAALCELKGDKHKFNRVVDEILDELIKSQES
jgi:hypothetical protein